jgi:proteasome alpha subunit
MCQITTDFNPTIYAVRPQAASMIVAGADQTGVQLYQVDPSGTFFRGAGFAIGQYSDIALDVIQKGYSADLSMEQALQLSNKAIEKALGEEPLVETGVVTAKDGSFKKLVNN